MNARVQFEPLNRDVNVMDILKNTAHVSSDVLYAMGNTLPAIKAAQYIRG